MNAEWFGKQNLENQDCSGKNTVFSHWSACTQDPVHLRTQILAWALKPDLPHHSSTPHLKHTIVFSVTLWSLLLRSLTFTTYSTGGFTGTTVCEASSALSCPFFQNKDSLFITLSIPDGNSMLLLINEQQPERQLQKLLPWRASTLLCFAWTLLQKQPWGKSNTRK